MKSIGIGQKNFKFLAINIRQCCHNIKIHVQKRKRTEKISWETHKFLTFFWLWAKIFQFFVEKWSATLPKLHSVCSRKKIDGKKFCRKNCSDRVFFRFMSQFSLDFSQRFENFAGVVKTATFMSGRTFWAFIFENLSSYFCFWTLSWKFLDFGIKIWPLLSILQVTFPRERTSLEFFGSPLEFLILNAFPRFFGKKIGSVAKTALFFYLSIGRFWLVIFAKTLKFRKDSLTLNRVFAPSSHLFSTLKLKQCSACL